MVQDKKDSTGRMQERRAEQKKDEQDAIVKAIVAPIVAFSVALGSVWRWPLPPALAATYGAMILAQSRGVAIVGAIHNSTAAQLAAAAPDDVTPDTEFEALCRGRATARTLSRDASRGMSPGTSRTTGRRRRIASTRPG